MNAVRVFSFLFGLILIAAGVAGYLPALTTDNMLLGIFMVDSTHNVVHIVTGIIGIIAAGREFYARLYFQLFGLIYAVIAVVGFWRAGDLYIMQVNMADNILHLVIAIVALYFGFVLGRRAID